MAKTLGNLKDWLLSKTDLDEKIKRTYIPNIKAGSSNVGAAFNRLGQSFKNNPQQYNVLSPTTLRSGMESVDYINKNTKTPFLKIPFSAGKELMKTYEQGFTGIGKGAKNISKGKKLEGVKDVGLGTWNVVKTPLALAGGVIPALAAGGISGVLSGGMAGLRGEDMSEATGKGFTQGLQTRALTRFTDPFIGKATGSFAPINNTLSRQSIQRAVSGAGNVGEDFLLSKLDQSKYGKEDAGLSFLIGAASAGNVELLNKILRKNNIDKQTGDGLRKMVSDRNRVSNKIAKELRSGNDSAVPELRVKRDLIQKRIVDFLKSKESQRGAINTGEGIEGAKKTFGIKQEPTIKFNKPFPWETKPSKKFMSTKPAPALVMKDSQAQGGIPSTKNKPTMYDKQSMDEISTTAVLNESDNRKGWNKLFDRFIGETEVGKTKGYEVGSKHANITKEQAPEVIKALEGSSFKKTPEVVNAVEGLRKDYDVLFQDAKDSGIDIKYLKNYLTHIWKQTPDQVSEQFQRVKGQFGFAKQRTYPTYEEGLKMGLTPKYTNPAEIIANYTNTLERTKAAINLINEGKKQGFIVDTVVGKNYQGFEPILAKGFPRSSSRIGNGALMVDNYYAPSSIAQEINNVFTPTNAGNMGKFLDKTGKASGTIQTLGLSGGGPATPLNAFTAAQTIKELTAGRVVSPLKSLVSATMPGGAKKYFTKNVNVVKEMQLNNLPLSTTMTPDNVVPKGFFSGGLGNVWNKLMEEPTFKKFMPMLQIEFYKDIKAKQISKGIPEDQAIATAVKATKNFYGLTGTGEAAKQNKVTQDLLKTVFFAPKFRESMVGFWVNNLKAVKNPLAPENINNTKFVMGAVITYGAMNALNQKINGKPMSENPPGYEDKLLIPVGNGDVIGVPFLSSIATVPRGVYRQGKKIISGDYTGAVKDAAQTYLSMGLKPLTDVAANKDYFGRDIAPEGATATERHKAVGSYLANQLLMHPYLKEMFGKKNQEDPAYQRLSRAMEMPLRFYTEKGIQAGYYYSAKDKAVKGLTAEERSALDSIPKTDITKEQDPNTRIMKYQTYLTYPNVFAAKQNIELQMSKETGKAIDPLYLVDYETAKKYMRYETLPEGSQDRKAMTKAYPDLLALFEVRGKYFEDNPIEGAATSKRPVPSDYVQQQMDAKNWKDPAVRNYLDANTMWQNSQREKLGLPPLEGFQSWGSGGGRKYPGGSITRKKISIKAPSGGSFKIGSQPKFKLAGAKAIKGFRFA